MDMPLKTNSSSTTTKVMDMVTTPLVSLFLKTLDCATRWFKLDVPQVVHLDELRELPAGTLGCAWAEHLDEQGLKPFTSGSRLKQIHDGVHVLGNYDTTPLGEAEVQCFLLGTHFRPQHLLLTMGLIVAITRHLRQNHDLRSFPRYWQQLVKAYQRGQMSSFDFLAWHPEEQWAVPLEELRANYNIVDA